MYGTTITFEGNLATELDVNFNREGSMYVDAIVLVNHGKDPGGKDRPATRWNVRITGRTAENVANLSKGDRLIITGTVVTDSWTDKATGDNRYAQRILASSVGVSLTFARVTGIDRNTTHSDATVTGEQDQ